MTGRWRRAAVPMAAALSAAGTWNFMGENGSFHNGSGASGLMESLSTLAAWQLSTTKPGNSKITTLGLPSFEHMLTGWPSLVTVAQADAPAPTPSLETAYRACLLQPLYSYMPDVAPYTRQPLTGESLAALEAAALAGFDSSQPLQVVTVVWALAWAGHQSGPEFVKRLQAAVASGSLPGAPKQRLSAAHHAVLLWSAVMLGAVTPDIWDAALRSLSAASSPSALDDCALLYLLHAALLHATDVAPAGRRTAAGTAGRPPPASPASAATPACQPRATREEVLSVAAPLGRKVVARLGEAYSEYVPLHPAVEGPYLALLFVMEQLAAGSAGQGGGNAGADEGGWMPPGAAEMAANMLSNPKELARLRRDLLYHWRGDTLLDEVQRARNQMVYLLTRRMGHTVAQPEDVDIVVPSRWLAIYVRSSSSSSGASSSSAGTFEDLQAATAETLELLVRDRFAPQVRTPSMQAAPPAVAPQQQQQGGGGSMAGGGPAGMWAARVRQLKRLGWRVAVVDARTWGSLQGDAEQEAHLQRLLRGGGL